MNDKYRSREIKDSVKVAVVLVVLIIIIITIKK